MTESTNDGSTSWRRAILATNSFTVRLGSASGLGAAGGVVGTTFSGTTREATTVLRMRRPLRLSAWTTVVVRVGAGSGGAPSRTKATRVMGTSIKQNLAILFMPIEIAEFSLYSALRRFWALVGQRYHEQAKAYSTQGQTQIGRNKFSLRS